MKDCLEAIKGEEGCNLLFPTVSCTHLKPRSKAEHKVFKRLDFLGIEKSTSCVSWSNGFGVHVYVHVFVYPCVRMLFYLSS